MHIDFITHLVCLLELSFNQPKFCLSASWEENATTFYKFNTNFGQAFGFFISTNNSIFWAVRNRHLILVFGENNPVPIYNISQLIQNPRGIFVTSNGNLYIDQGSSNTTVQLWTPGATSGSPIFFVNGSCHALFIDILGQFYCSMDSIHVVLTYSTNNSMNSTTIIAGNGTYGSTPWQLSSPNGIYVDQQLNLYVADCMNNRIQLFRPGQRNGTTVVSANINGTIALNRPTALVFDADGNMFIADLGNNRIVRSSPTGFWCIAGCTKINGSAAHQLNEPRNLAFDSHGNLFVSDARNYRIQKFLFITESCGTWIFYSF